MTKAEWMEGYFAGSMPQGRETQVASEAWDAAFRAGLEEAAKVMDDKADHCLQLAEDAPRKEAVWHTRRKEALMYEGAAAAIRAEP